MQNKNWIKNQLGINSNLYIYQDKTMFNYSIDTILLGNFIRLTRKIINILEVGANNGALSIFVNSRSSKLKIDALEIQEEALPLLKYNIELNKMGQNITPTLGDFNYYKFNKTYDLIMINPPFYTKKDTKHIKNMSKTLRIANIEEKLTLNDLLKKAKSLLRPKGYLSLILPINRLDELFVLANNNSFAVKRIQMIFPRINSKPISFLAELRNFKTQNLDFLPNLYLHNNDLKDSSYQKNILDLYKPIKIE